MPAKEVITIFYSTTEEGYVVKYRSYFNALAQQIGKLLDVHLEILYWKDMPGGVGSSGQDVIDQFVAGKYQIYVGIMGTRFGSGTEHEYRLAIESYQSVGAPMELFFGFCEEPINPYSIDLATFGDVKKFKSDIGTSGKYGVANLYATFKNKKEFEERFSANLKKAIETVKHRVSGGLRVS